MRLLLTILSLSMVACGDDGAVADGGGLDGAVADGGGLDGAVADGGGDDGAVDVDGGSDGGTHSAVCPGFTAPASPCRTEADCSASSDSCILPGTPLCGACMVPVRDCEDDGGCKGADVCVEMLAPCSCGGPSSSCAPPCTAGSCAAGDVCASDGHCNPESCSAGFSCQVNSRCDPKSSGADAHGCVVLPCAMDDDCDCGVCIGSVCMPVAGQCGSLPG